VPTFSFQTLLAPLLLVECLQARLQDSIDVITNVLDDTPSEHQPVRLAIIDALSGLETATHQLRFTRLVLLLDFQQRLQRHLQAHNSLPAIEDIDDSSDSQP